MTTVTDLHRRLLSNVSRDTTDLAAGEVSIPADGFLSESVHEAERARLFAATPQPVAFSGEIPDSQCFLSLDILNTPVLLTRSGDGQLHAFINSCAHRGAILTRGSGRARSLTCAFHGWSYKHDGKLRGRPREGYFTTESDNCSLIPLPVSEKSGIVFVSIDQDMATATLDGAASGLEVELVDHGFRNYRTIERRHFEVAANWKLVSDLSLESYHFNTLHRNSVAQVLESHAVFDTMGIHSRWAFPLQSIRRLEELKEEDWPDTLQGSCTYTLYPGVMFIVNSLGAQMIRAEPGDSPSHCRVTYAGVCAPGCEMEEATAAYRFGGKVFQEEDLPIAEACQRGIGASRRDLLLGRNEPLLQFWHGLWQDALG